MPCMRCCRACCVFSPKLGIIIQDFARQLFDQLLADQAILMAGGAVLTLPPPIPVERSHGFLLVRRPAVVPSARHPP